MSMPDADRRSGPPSCGISRAALLPMLPELRFADILRTRKRLRSPNAGRLLKLRAMSTVQSRLGKDIEVTGTLKFKGELLFEGKFKGTLVEEVRS